MAKSIMEESVKFIFSTETFENENQFALNAYLTGFCKKMIPEVTQMWGNCVASFKPFIVLAKENRIRFVASNISSKYMPIVN